MLSLLIIFKKLLRFFTIEYKMNSSKNWHVFFLSFVTCLQVVIRNLQIEICKELNYHSRYENKHTHNIPLDHTQYPFIEMRSDTERANHSWLIIQSTCKRPLTTDHVAANQSTFNTSNFIRSLENYNTIISQIPYFHYGKIKSRLQLM